MKPSINCLAWYKGRPALVTELGEKITITAGSGKETTTVKVREKDIEVLHPGPVTDLSKLINQTENTVYDDQTIYDAWELIESGAVPVDLAELAELVYGEFTPYNALAARFLLSDGLYFTGTIDAVCARTAEEISSIEEKRQGKAKESQEREAFLERLRKGTFNPQEDGRFLQDVEALAYGKTDKSRTMKELGKTETPAAAHRFLLECGFWDKWINPYPRRFGLSFSTGGTAGAAASGDPSPLKRTDLTHLRSFAIDSPWSTDPDDALSLEINNGRRVLYVHVADPASVVKNGSPEDLSARARGATLYLPEGKQPMLGEEILSGFALGIQGTANDALTIKIDLNEDGAILETEIFPSLVQVTQFSYEEADRLAEEAEKQHENSGMSTDAAMLGELFALSEIILERRLNAGAVNIALPEVHITVAGNKVQIKPIVPYRSAGMVRECMIAAGEAAAAWASRRQLPFPYIIQETGDLPSRPLPGFAGSLQLRRCMRPRSVSAKPGYHWALGLDSYSQVTSPLRRYTDLLAHQQIRAFLCKEAGMPEPASLDEEALLFCLAAGDAAAQATIQAERASKLHWTAVYLDELLTTDPKGEFIWDAVVTEKRANGLGIIIPALGLETQTGGSGLPNDEIKVRLKSVRIPELEINFVKL